MERHWSREQAGEWHEERQDSDDPGERAAERVRHAAALELRPRGIHVALLIFDAGIQLVSGPGVAPETLADPSEIADAVRFLAGQRTRAPTHELQLTPLAETWVP